jgi:lysophospholipase L1-like esterase
MTLLQSDRYRRKVRVGLGATLVAAALATTALRVLPAAAEDGLQYVALGDSSAAGPEIPEEVHAECHRSDRNWPRELEAILNATVTKVVLKDVTCSGARVGDLIAPQTQFARPPSNPQPVPAQIDAVNEESDLVTLAIGANDIRGGGAMLACSTPNIYLFPDEQKCQDRLADPRIDIDFPQLIAQTGQSVAAVLRQIRGRTKAPVFVVGYLTYWKEDGCQQDGDPYTAEAANYLQDRLDDLMEELAKQADANGAHYVDIRGPSRDHGLCGPGEIWLKGNTGSFPYHPTAAGMEGAADEIAKAVTPHLPAG